MMQDVAAKEWTARCLTLNVAAKGESRQQAARLVQDEVLKVLEDDLSQGRDPFERESAGEEYWSLLQLTLRHGRPLASVRDPNLISVVAGQLHMRTVAAPGSLDVEMSPLTWQLAAVVEQLAGGPSG